MLHERNELALVWQKQDVVTLSPRFRKFACEKVKLVTYVDKQAMFSRGKYGPHACESEFKGLVRFIRSRGLEPGGP